MLVKCLPLFSAKLYVDEMSPTLDSRLCRIISSFLYYYYFIILSFTIIII